MNSLTNALATTAICGLCASSGSANVIVDNQADFLTAVGNVVVEEELFLNRIDGAPSITFESGVTSVASGGNTTLFGDNSVIDDTAFGDGEGEFFSAVGPSSVSPTSITWTFDRDVVGFFGSFESVSFVRMTFLDSGNNVVRSFNFDQVLPSDPINGIDGFVGYANDSGFNQIRFTAIPGVDFETFSVNSFQFTDGTPVPTPATAALLIGAGAISPKRRRGGRACGAGPAPLPPQHR